MKREGRHQVRDHVSGSLSELDQQVVKLVPPGGNWRDLPDDFPSRRVQQIRQSAAAGEGNRSTYYGRLQWGRPSYTISTYITRPGNGCHIHPEYDRLITTREAARLQTFPDNIEFVGSNRARTMQVGNAVPPLLAYAVASVLSPGRYIDLFSGAGGLSLGFEWAGHELMGAIDSDDKANEVARRAHNTDKIVTADLSDASVLSQTLRGMTASSHPEILIGGPPCQGFSTAGTGRLSDERNRLVFAFLDAVEQLGPRVVLMENVPALLWRGRRFLAGIRSRLHGLGYATSVIIAHAEAYGVPQLRRRLLLQAVSAGEPVWPIPHHRVLDPAHRSNQPGSDVGVLPVRTVGDAIGDLPARVAEDGGSAVTALAPTSDYQRWARGEVSVSKVAEGYEGAPPGEVEMFSASSAAGGA